MLTLSEEILNFGVPLPNIDFLFGQSKFVKIVKGVIGLMGDGYLVEEENSNDMGKRDIRKCVAYDKISMRGFYFTQYCLSSFQKLWRFCLNLLNGSVDQNRYLWYLLQSLFD